MSLLIVEPSKNCMFIETFNNLGSKREVVSRWENIGDGPGHVILGPYHNTKPGANMNKYFVHTYYWMNLTGSNVGPEDTVLVFEVGKMVNSVWQNLPNHPPHQLKAKQIPNGRSFMISQIWFKLEKEFTGFEMRIYYKGKGQFTFFNSWCVTPWKQ